jgi:hypothetical protein
MDDETGYVFILTLTEYLKIKFLPCNIGLTNAGHAQKDCPVMLRPSSPLYTNAGDKIFFVYLLLTANLCPMTLSYEN